MTNADPYFIYLKSVGNNIYAPKEAFLLNGNPARKEVALTFDDGPNAKSRSQILDILKQHGAKATFFDVGINMEKHPELVKRTLAEGHEMANHSHNHQRLTLLPAQARHTEVNDTDIVYYAITGQHLRYLRPPGMRYNAEVLATVRDLGYITIGYSSASQDFHEDGDPDNIVERTLRNTHNGSILLLHDYEATAKALPKILERLKADGKTCVTITEMLRNLPTPVVHPDSKETSKTP